MVEKTRRSVSVLRRCQESDREELNYWRRRSSEQEDPRKGGSGSGPFSKTHSPHSAESGERRAGFSLMWAAETSSVVVIPVIGAYCCPQEGDFIYLCFMYAGMNPDQWKSGSYYSFH